MALFVSCIVWQWHIEKYPPLAGSIRRSLIISLQTGSRICVCGVPSLSMFSMPMVQTIQDTLPLISTFESANSLCGPAHSLDRSATTAILLVFYRHLEREEDLAVLINAKQSNPVKFAGKLLTNYHFRRCCAFSSYYSGVGVTRPENGKQRSRQLSRSRRWWWIPRYDNE